MLGAVSMSRIRYWDMLVARDADIADIMRNRSGDRTHEAITGC
jgi:hypothetical protein